MKYRVLKVKEAKRFIETEMQGYSGLHYAGSDEDNIYFVAKHEMSSVKVRLMVERLMLYNDDPFFIYECPFWEDDTKVVASIPHNWIPDEG